MVTTRSQDRKLGASSSPLPAVEAGTDLSPYARLSPTAKSKAPSASTLASRKSLASPANQKIEVVIDVAPNHGAAPNPLEQETSQSGGRENGQGISPSQPRDLVPHHESSFQGVLEDSSSNHEARTMQSDDRSALEGRPKDSREVPVTLAERSKHPMSPNQTSASVPKRKRFTSEDLDDMVPGSELPADQLARPVTPNAADREGVEESDDGGDDAPPEVVSSSDAAQQVLGVPNPSLQHTNRKRRKILRNADDEFGSPVRVPELAATLEPQTSDTAQEKGEEPTTAGQIPQQNGGESEAGEASKPIKNNSSTVNATPQETIEIVTTPRSNESSDPANTTTQSARKKTGPRTPDNFDTTTQLQPSEPLAEEGISTSNETTRQILPGEQEQLAVNLSTSLPQDTSMADGGPSVTNSDVRYSPPQRVSATELPPESSATIPAPEGHAQSTTKFQANTAEPSVGVESPGSVYLSTQTQPVESDSVKMANFTAPTPRARPRGRPPLHEQEVLSTPKPTSLQQYRTRLLGRHPRTNNWGAPGFRRKAKFVGA
ncbi:uncharacterized protein Z520_07064 [Fonsecaea multimorphosa CBS 102226]|uniref:Uncharacterized protein n=1 Tax=Fonsecaea multimorphosa CBS 102226 TaxID=1442371 RepID=A0A0D2H560_9EURO|nr:uncharacterized protein Z520_07064 [Fonsecaea multimorphosa CBS 102226]KIX96950.1 hypothetical protein Z520_07064 [Fonsecaea multimorphosa CBS 102226]OAL23147.1 hypothetical protein AYO22_06640 [Fonsecaea multimorphosa]